MSKQTIFSIIAIVGLSACTNRVKTNEMSAIDSTLQSEVTVILREKMVDIDAPTGQVIVMETKTGEIKALVSLDSLSQSIPDFAYQYELGDLATIPSLIAVLDNPIGKQTSTLDSVDTGNGIFVYKGGTIRDGNWSRGGYQKITLEEALMVSSNIGIVKAVSNVYEDEPERFFEQWKKMSYGEPASIEGIDNLQPAVFYTPKDKDWEESYLAFSAIGYNQEMAPIQMLAFYNAIANNGVMVKPTLYKGETEIINPQIATAKTIQSTQQVMEICVSDGLAKPAGSELVKVAGKSGTAQVDINGEMGYSLSFCGYFPADNPQYTIIVTMSKKELPVSGSLMAGNVFRKIAELLCGSENKN